MEDSINIIEISIFLIMFLVNFLVYGYSSAIQNISDSQLKRIEQKNTKTYRKIIRIIENPYKFVNTIQVTSMLMTICAGAFEVTFITRFIQKLLNNDDIYGNGIGALFIFVIETVVFVWLILSVGIMIPKGLGRRHAVGFASSLSNIAYVIMIFFTPITVMASGFSGIILKVLGISDTDEIDNVTEEDIVSVVNEGHEQGILLKSEADMITNIVEFGDKEAKDIMTHRNSVICIDSNMKLEDALELMLKQNKSRFPTYEDNVDNILGIVNLRDAIQKYQDEENRNMRIMDLEGLIREATFIPETRKINILFKNMQSDKIHMAIVVDEYGQMAGIVAMEDILEEIVGNILDEYDEDDKMIIKKEDGSFVVNGIATLEDISKETGIDYSNENFETLNGFLTSKFGRILTKDEKPQIVVNGVKYKILSVQKRFISSVQIILNGVNE